jgi:hypothetical protein
VITFRTLGKLGRFGNQLFEYTGTRLYAELNGYSWAMPDWIGATIFQDVRPYTALEHLRARLLPTVQLSDMQSVSALHQAQRLIRLWCKRDMQELYRQPSDNIDLYGYMQDPYSLEMLHRHRQRVRSWFRLQPHIDQAFRQSTKKYGSWVGLHIRRGDLVKRNLTVPTSLYLEVARSLPLGTNICISSDDATMADQFREYTVIKPANPLPDVPDFIFDFWMLQHASTIYGCGSTFSWWAAYLSDKDTYYGPPLTHLWKTGQPPVISRQDL